MFFIYLFTEKLRANIPCPINAVVIIRMLGEQLLAFLESNSRIIFPCIDDTLICIAIRLINAAILFISGRRIFRKPPTPLRPSRAATLIFHGKTKGGGSRSIKFLAESRDQVRREAETDRSKRLPPSFFAAFTNHFSPRHGDNRSPRRISPPHPRVCRTPNPFRNPNSRRKPKKPKPRSLRATRLNLRGGVTRDRAEDQRGRVGGEVVVEIKLGINRGGNPGRSGKPEGRGCFRLSKQLSWSHCKGCF